MAVIGADLRGGMFRSQFAGSNPAGLGVSLALAAGLLILNLGLQVAISLAIQVAIYGAPFLNKESAVRGALLGMLPAAVITAIAAWYAAKVRGGNPREVLNLRWPDLGALGWGLVTGGFFLVVMILFGIILGVLKLIGIDQPPGGLVEDAMAGLAKDPKAYLQIVPSVIVGAPLAEELVFRGQLFTALSQTRAGFVGATILTSAAWSALHYTGNGVLVGLIFVMGLVLGWLLYRFGSLWVTMACHAVWNLSTSLVIFTQPPT